MYYYYYKDKDGKPHQGPIPEPHLSKLLSEGGSKISEEEFRNIESSNNKRSFSEQKTDKLSIVNIEKNKLRDSGFILDGIKYDSDQAARISYLELNTYFSLNKDFKINFKSSDGVWVEIDYDLYLKVMEALRNHIQKSYDWFKEKENEIAMAKTEKQLNKISVIYKE